MRDALAEVLSEDEDHAAVQSERSSVVNSAQRSESPTAKDATRQTTTGFAVQSSERASRSVDIVSPRRSLRRH